MAKALILIAEDEPRIAALLADYLEQSAFATHSLHTGAAVVEWVRHNAPDLVLLDLMLPEKDGLTICRELRAFSSVPILMVTARVDEIDRLLGLEAGADDYICKPFSPREIVARVKAVLRRVEQYSEDVQGDYRGITLDVDTFKVTARGKRLELTPVEFRLLQTLVKKPGRVWSRDQLMSHLYNDGRIVNDRTMDTHVKNLRRKLATAMPEEELIHSVYGVGYRLE